MSPQTSTREGYAVKFNRLLQIGAIEFAIAKQYHQSTWWDDVLHLLDHGDMEVFGKMPFFASAHNPAKEVGAKSYPR